MHFDRMRDALSGYVNRGEIPGLVALVARDGEVHVEAMGTSAAGGGRPVRRDTIFRVSSMSKPVTAAATMILVDEGKLQLDEPIERVLPELANRRVLRSFDAELDDTVPAIRSITVRDLLTFTMGFGILMVPPGKYPIQRANDDLKLGQGRPEPQVPPSPETWLARFATLPLLHQPGARWMYSTGADVLGVVIARASGMSFPAFLHERLFAPLGMVDTAFFVPKSKQDRFVDGYYANPTTGALEHYDDVDGAWGKPPACPSGAAGLVSTADDFRVFGEMLLGRGARGATRILSEASADAMMRDQLTEAQKKASNDFFGYFAQHGWGFGGSVVTGNDVAGGPGTFGWDGGLGTCWRVLPKERAVTVLMTQRSWTSPVPPPQCDDFWRTTGEALRSALRSRE